MPRKPNMQSDRYNDPFPTRLRELISERNLVQHDPSLLNALGVKNRQSVTRYIDGSANPTPAQLVSLSQLFGVTTDWLVGIPGAVKHLNPDCQQACLFTGLSEASVYFLHDLAVESNFETIPTKRNILNVLDMLLDYDSFEYWNRIQAFMFTSGAGFNLSLQAGNFPISRDDLLTALLTQNNSYLRKLKGEIQEA